MKLEFNPAPWPAQQILGAGNTDGHDTGLTLHRDVRKPGPSRSQQAGPTAALGENTQHTILRQDTQRLLERRSTEAASIGADKTPKLGNHARPQRRVWPVRTADKFHHARTGVKHQGRIHKIEMVRGQNDRAGCGHMLSTDDFQIA